MPNICQIDEIIRVVCGYCDSQSLARLARTNKAFSDPALDVLWDSLSSFSHLLRLLPDDLVTWHTTNYGDSPRPLVNHLIIPRDWRRFSLYSHRVRSWLQEDLSYVDEPVVDHIAFGRLPGYILPRLTHLEVTATSVSGVHLQTLILCPTLQSVSIWNRDPTVGATRAMHTFFRTLADRAPALKKLVVHWGGGATVTDSFKDGLSDVYSSVYTLQSVHLWSPGCVTPVAFRLLAELPLLNTLHLNLIGVLDADMLCSQVRNLGVAFPSLQNIFLAGELDEFEKTLRCFGEQRMASIGFSVQEYPKAEALRTLFQAVAAHFSASLRILQFNVPKDEIDESANRQFSARPELYQPDIAVLRPLLAVRGLVAVHLELGVPLQLDDAALAAVARAWADVEILNLCCDPYCERTKGARPVATVRGLFALAERCARLRHLGLFVDYSLFVDADLVAGCGTLAPSVVQLDVGKSWIIHPPLVAALLSGTFPALKIFQWSGMGDSETWREFSGGHSHGWKQVFDLLPVFRATRVNERRVRILDTVDMNVD